MTTQAPPGGVPPGSVLPDAPGQISYPLAVVLPSSAGSDPVVFESDDTQTYQGGVYRLDRNVVITWKDRRVQADHIEYDANTGDVTANGHLVVTGGANDERITASHGSFNVKSETGRFYDVTGSAGIKPARRGTHLIYTNSNPFLFTGRIVVKTGPQNYEIYDGTVTSCQLPSPDWMLDAGHFSIDGSKVRARDSTFRLFNLPLLFLPYVTHPADSEERQSGLLVPTIGESSTKGFVIGEEIYLALNRSSDLTVGAEFYSSIGYAQMATFHLRGPGASFLTAHYSGVLDGRAGAANQGGEEIVLAGRYDFAGRQGADQTKPAGEQTRAAAHIDYLSSYVYREAFSDSFNQAVTSDIVSMAYLTHHHNGFEMAAEADRYQGIKLVAQGSTPQQQVRLFHVPTFSFSSTDHGLGSTGLRVSLDAAVSGLKRTQPGFESGGIIERLDLHPQVAYPIALAQWHVLPTIAARETLYTRSRFPTLPLRQNEEGLVRSDFEFTLGIRPPVIERTFAPMHLRRLLGAEFRHTVEPEVTYRLTDGVADFSHVLRFDARDVVSNTNELEYGVTQHLYRRPARAGSGAEGKACETERVAREPGFGSQAESDSESPVQNEVVTGHCVGEEFISWRLTQKYFFDQSFGGAINNGRRNIFETTLDFSGVAFLTEPRRISPLVSRLRVRSSAHTDVEWDFDYDTGATKFTSSNVFIDLHEGNSFTALSYARLDAPGRFFTQNPTPPSGSTTSGVTSLISDFNQLRLLLGYGSPAKAGLSLAGSAGIDLKHLYGTTQNTSANAALTVYPALLQYASLQGAYNWNCCGLTMEYRKFELGSTRNEGTYRFNFTLVNIGAAGNLRKAERLF